VALGPSVTTFVQFAVIGLGLGAAYALLAQGLVVIQIGSGVVNFAQGAMAMLGAFIYYWLAVEQGWSFAPAFVASTAAVGAFGVLVYQLIMRPLRSFSALTRVIATLGVLLTLESFGFLQWGDIPRFVRPFLPTRAIDFGGGVFLGEDKLIALGIAVGLTVVLWGVYRYTNVGLAIRAAAENERGIATFGWSGQALATLTWAAGGALAGSAGVLLAPLAALNVVDMTLLVIPALAAALAGGFVSFPLTLLGAVAIGMGQSLLANYLLDTVPGVVTALPFALIIGFLVIRGRSLPVRGATSTAKLPELGTGRVRWRFLALAAGGWICLTLLAFPTTLLDAVTTSVAWGIILFSVVILMGFTGQVDLAPLAWGGLAALVAARLVRLNVPFELAILIGIAGAIPVGLLFGIPALRARGLNLAVVTLGLGVMLHAMVFGNATIAYPTSGDAAASAQTGIYVGPQTFFGVDVGPFDHPGRYFVLVFVAFVLVALLAASVRRGRAGRRLIAVRTNERAAAALGISVFSSKLYAFGLSAAIAALGGIFLGFRQYYVNVYITFDPINSMLAAAHAVIGGVGFVLGPVFAAQFAVGGIGSWILNTLFPGANQRWIALLGGVAVLVILLQAPNGLVSLTIKAAQAAEGQSKLAYLRPEVLVLRLWARFRRWLGKDMQVVPQTLPEVSRESVRLSPATLEVRELTVRYGGVTAVDGVSLVVRPGEVVGLIGPNGAGKTSLIDAVTGFAPAAAGEVRLDGTRIDGWPVHRRARAGVARSFQNLELFESVSLRENLQIAGDPRDAWAYAKDLVAPGKTPLPALTVVAIRELGLEQELDRTPADIAYGARRLAGIARTIATRPRVLLLDEPVAGLGERETAELAHVVRRLAKEWGLGILVVEHDMGFVMGVCDEIVVLDFGHPIAAGTPDDIRSNPAVITAYLGEPEPAAVAAEPS
jgi:sulfate-transporting ATPase